MTVALVIQESDSVQEVTLTTPLFVETTRTANTHQKVLQTSQLWDTFWCNETKNQNRRQYVLSITKPPLEYDAHPH